MEAVTLPRLKAEGLCRQSLCGVLNHAELFGFISFLHFYIWRFKRIAEASSFLQVF
jgi:hypothetical protein